MKLDKHERIVIQLMVLLEKLEWHDTTEAVSDKSVVQTYAGGAGDHMWVLSLHDDGELSLLHTDTRTSDWFRVPQPSQMQLGEVWARVAGVVPGARVGV